MTEQQLPEGWQMVKFGDIAKHISKRVEPSETDLEIYVGLEHLDPDSLKIKRHGTPSDVEGQKLLVKKGQIIFGKRRAYQRKVAVADRDCICSAHAMVLEANQHNVIPEFLPFFMQSDVFMHRAIAISEGSLSPTIKWKVLSSQQFCLPNKDVQKKILVLVSKIDELLDLQSAVASSLRDLKLKLENKLFFGGYEYSSNDFLGFVNLMKGKVVKLRDVISTPSGGVSVRSSEGLLQDNDIGILKTSCVKSGRFIVSEVKQVIHDDLERVKNNVEKDTVIFSRMNTPDFVGEVGYVEKTLKNIFLPDRLWAFKSKDSDVTTKFISQFLSSQQIRKALGKLSTGTSASMKNISKPKLLSLDFPKLPKDVISNLEEIFTLLEVNEQAITKKIASTKRIKMNFLNIKLGK